MLLVVPLLLAAALPTFGAAARKLTDPTVSPRSGTTSTKIVFEVTYTRPLTPGYVRVVVGGTNHKMSKVSGGDWSGEGRFRWSGTLPAGTHSVVFQGSGVKDLAAGTVKITVPPKPKPDPTPTPKPKPSPTPKPDPTPTPKPDPSPTPRSLPSPLPTPSPTPAGIPLAPPSQAPWPTSDPTPTPSPTPQPTEIVTGVLPGPVAPPPAGSGGSGGGSIPVDPPDDPGAWSPTAAVASALGLDTWRILPPLGLVPTLVTTTGVATSVMALSIFGKRRREDGQLEDDEVLADRAAQGVGVLSGPVGVAVAAALAAAPEIPDIEAGMPRWRRPSLLQARKADPIRDGVEVARLTFDNGLIGPIEGRERRVIKYDVVTLLDAPDEVRGNGIGVLTQGDEIQLLEKRGVYWLVLCPDGSQGWVHKMTVGELVGEDRRPDGARASIPTVAESWTLGEDDIDDDVLSAYLAARRRE
jgi:hypothetical protein